MGVKPEEAVAVDVKARFPRRAAARLMITPSVVADAMRSRLPRAMSSEGQPTPTRPLCQARVSPATVRSLRRLRQPVARLRGGGAAACGAQARRASVAAPARPVCRAPRRSAAAELPAARQLAASCPAAFSAPRGLAVGALCVPPPAYRARAHAANAPRGAPGRGCCSACDPRPQRAGGEDQAEVETAGRAGAREKRRSCGRTSAAPRRRVWRRTCGR